MATYVTGWHYTLFFVGTVDLVDKGRLVEPLDWFVTLCLAKVADP